MKTKKYTWIWIVSILLVVILAGVSYYYLTKDKKLTTLGIHYYLNDTEIFPDKVSKYLNQQSFIMNSLMYYDSISFDIISSNEGNNELYVRIDSASPEPFNSSLNKNLIIVNVGDSNIILWKSNNITTTQFENYTQPIRFYAKINIYRKEGTNYIFLDYEEVYLDLIILSHRPFVIFRISTKQPNGDSTFHDSIGWKTTCDSTNLIRAGEYSTGGADTSNRACLIYMPTIGYTKMFDISEGIITNLTRGSSFADNTFSLWNKGYDYGLCGNSPTNGRAVYINYRVSSLGHAEGLVSDSSVLTEFNPNEMYC